MTSCGGDYQEFHDRFGIDLFIAGVQAKADQTRAERDAAASAAAR
jgi:hypothetical protein